MISGCSASNCWAIPLKDLKLAFVLLFSGV
jgi:hypothetical protein